MFNKSVLNARDNSELLSYIINVTPELRDNIDLPVQGESIMPIGQIIINNARYRNAFLNTINLIGLTVIKRNGWDNPWNFTKRGMLNFGQQIREIVLDLCKPYDYNANFADKEGFLKTEVPNVFQYLHEINFQKFYKTTVSDAQIAMAFNTADGLFELINIAIEMLYESLKYDTYITDKYMLCRRILDGTVTPTEIENYDTLTARQRVSAIKAVSNKFTFRSPNYNPAGIRKATSFADQILIVNTEFEADFTTEVLATSFFRDEADMRARLALIDGFANHDTARLIELLGEAYIPFSEEELAELAKVPAVLISREWFMDYDYALDAQSAETKQTDFYNPQTLEKTTWLHAWRVFSTSPFENATVFTQNVEPTVTEIAVSPQESTVSAGGQVQLSAKVTTTGFANKAVIWSVTKGQDQGVTVTQTGLVTIPKEFSPAEDAIQITATSVFNSTVTGTASITVA